jgi:hypothetical protein
MLKHYIALLLIGSVWISCKKPDEPPIDCTPPSTTGTLRINFVAHYNGAPFAFFSDYSTVQNHRIQVETLRFLTTEFWAQTTASDSVYIHDAFKYNFATNTTYVDVAMNPGDYTGIGFSLGVPASKNHSDPTVYPATHPLSLNVSGDMHWAWNTGYIFTKFEGKADTSGTGTGPLNISYVFHPGADTLYRQLPLFTHPFTISTGNTTVIDVDVNVAKFLSNLSDTIDLRYDNFTHTMGPTLPLAVRFTNLFQQAFSIP